MSTNNKDPKPAATPKVAKESAPKGLITVKRSKETFGNERPEKRGS